MRTLAAAFGFDCEKRVQELACGGFGGADGGRIEKRQRRSGHVDGFCLVVAGNAQTDEVRSKS